MNRGMTRKGAATRTRIVIAAAMLIREKGAGETTLDDVRAATATSKSQLFHYFPDGRSDMLVAVAEYEAEQVLEAQQPYLGDLTTWDSWQKWSQAVIDHYVELGERCPMGSLTSELGKSSPQACTVVTNLYDAWEAELVRGARALMSDDGSAADRARSILAAIQGGVVMLKATGKVDYLQAALTDAIEPLKPVGAAM